MRKAVTYKELMGTKLRTMGFEGEWFAHLGDPERKGSWIVWGNSGSGKTTYALKLAKYLCRFEKVLYNSVEEGISITLRKNMEYAGIGEVGNRFLLLDKEPIMDMIERLGKKKSANVVFLDSIQYAGLTYTQYKEIKKLFPNKLFILISQAEGKLPEGRLARRVQFDANIKIRVEGGMAKAASRYGSAMDMVARRELVEAYWGIEN